MHLVQSLDSESREISLVFEFAFDFRVGPNKDQTPSAAPALGPIWSDSRCQVTSSC